VPENLNKGWKGMSAGPGTSSKQLTVNKTALFLGMLEEGSYHHLGIAVSKKLITEMQEVLVCCYLILISDVNAIEPFGGINICIFAHNAQLSKG
jgi:hypothetical protein